MIRYLRKRFLWAVGSLFLTHIFVFILFISIPGDPTILLTKSSGVNQSAKSSEQIDLNQNNLKEKLGLNLPKFYLSIHPLNYPDTLFKILDSKENKAAEELFYRYGNWDLIEIWRNQLKIIHHSSKIKRRDISQLLSEGHPDRILSILNNSKEISSDEKFTLIRHFSQFEKSSKSIQFLIPSISWNSNNRFGNFLYSLFSSDFGRSIQDNRPVKEKIIESFGNTIILNIFVFTISILISIPLGIYLATISSIKWRIFSDFLIYSAYSMPVFWVAILAIQYLSGGNNFLMLPTEGIRDIKYSENWPLYKKILDRGIHLILPVVTLSYWTIAIMIKQIEVFTRQTLKEQYIITAQSKGLSYRDIVIKHGFRNALLPMITIWTDMLPGLISGSIVIEIIFSYPGMGTLISEAITYRDFAVAPVVLLLSSILIIFFTLLGDFLYHIADPRIRFADE